MGSPVLPAVGRRNLRWLQESDLVTLTRSEVAELMGVDPRTVTRAIEDGQLPSVRIGRRVLIPRLPLLAKLGMPDNPGGGDAA